MALSELGEKFHAAISAHMKKHGLTHGEVARRLRVTTQCVTQKLQSIRAGRSSLRTLERLARVLGLKLDASAEETKKP